jgi:peptide/nickel transport system permease protein
MIAKLLQYALTIWAVLTINFVLPRLIPGNPLAELDDPQGLPVPLSEDQRLRIMAYYGLDKPVAVQYRDYLVGLAHGDLGWSISYNAPVAGVLAGRLRWTLLLVGLATVIYVLLGVFLGCIAAWHHGGRLDRWLLAVTSATGSFPSFFLAMLLIVVFGVKLHWLPLGGARSATSLSAPLAGQAVDVARHMVLPIAALVLAQVGYICYLTRNAMIQTLGDTYITVAHAKGLPGRTVLFRHVLPNALLPIITWVAMRLGAMVMGAVMVETTFAYPGIGTAIVDASTSRDYPLLQGAFAVVMVSIMGANLLADLLNGWLDPRSKQAA